MLEVIRNQIQKALQEKVEIDIVASEKIMGFKKDEVLTNRLAKERGIFSSEAKIVGGKKLTFPLLKN